MVDFLCWRLCEERTARLWDLCDGVLLAGATNRCDLAGKSLFLLPPGRVAMALLQGKD